MATEISDFPSVQVRAEQLGCIVPRAFAILPANFDTVDSRTDFRLSGEGSTLRTLLRTGGLTIESLLPPGERAPYIVNNSIEWFGPTLFVSAALATQDPNAVSVALGLITNYLSDFFKGRGGSKTAKLAIVVEQREGRVCKKISYEGPVEGILALADTVRQISHDRSDH